MKKFLIFAGILCLTFLLYAGAQEKVVEPQQEVAVPAATETRLDVTIIDGINNKLIKLENCAVRVMGKLKLVEDTFNYSNTFTEGDRYEITINIRKKI